MKKLASLFMAVGLLCAFFLPAPAASAADIVCPPGEKRLKDTQTCCPTSTPDTATSCVYEKYINPMVRLLSIVAGLAVVFGMMYGGILYASSGGDPKKAADGKGKVISSLFALIAFMFLYGMLQFFSPGGLDGKSGLKDPGSPANAANCTHTFFGLKPWYAYLPEKTNNVQTFDTNCNIVDFQFLGNGANSGLIPIFLVIVDDLARVAAIVAVIFVIVGGVQYVTSQGEPDKTRSAKESILNAIIGLVIAMIAATVVSYVGTRISS